MQAAYKIFWIKITEISHRNLDEPRLIGYNIRNLGKK